MSPALAVSGLSVRFGGLVALADVSFDLAPGELVGLIGPNGAGKTTLVDALTGFVRYEGVVAAKGTPLDGLRPDQRAARGLARTFQSLELFDDLTVRENVAIGRVEADETETVEAALAAAGLGPVADRLPGELAPSTRRFVALARAVAARPSVLLLDEIAAGLDGTERAVLAARLRGVVRDGCGVLLVDHDLGLVSDLSDRVIVLAGGRVLAVGPPAEVRRDERVLAAYLGPER